MTSEWGDRMEQEVLQYFVILRDGNQQEKMRAFEQLMIQLNEPVDWTYAVWEQLVQSLTAPDVSRRGCACQLLCALAAHSDPEERVLDDFTKIWAVTFDETFEIARQSLSSIWKIGIAGKVQRELVVAHLANRYVHCMKEENYTIIRLEIMESLRKLYTITSEKRIEDLAKSLIEQEADSLTRQQYASLWK